MAALRVEAQLPVAVQAFAVVEKDLLAADAAECLGAGMALAGARAMRGFQLAAQGRPGKIIHAWGSGTGRRAYRATA
ncbi:hypothetical protein WJ971_21305 [Achromobacter xylosoxidans]